MPQVFALKVLSCLNREYNGHNNDDGDDDDDDDDVEDDDDNDVGEDHDHDDNNVDDNDDDDNVKDGDNESMASFYEHSYAKNPNNNDQPFVKCQSYTIEICIWIRTDTHSLSIAVADPEEGETKLGPEGAENDMKVWIRHCIVSSSQ